MGKVDILTMRGRKLIRIISMMMEKMRSEEGARTSTLTNLDSNLKAVFLSYLLNLTVGCIQA